jgi:hypothetical protein
MFRSLMDPHIGRTYCLKGVDAYNVELALLLVELGIDEAPGS